MQSKNMMADFVSDKYYLHEGQLFTLKNSEEDPSDDASALKVINGRFNQFKSMNSRFYASKKLMPDSVMINFMKKK